MLNIYSVKNRKRRRLNGVYSVKFSFSEACYFVNGLSLNGRVVVGLQIFSGGSFIILLHSAKKETAQMKKT